MISLKQLSYALAVEKTRHFKKAADISAISQSALSTAIAELESQLNTQIFERDNKKVLVTPAGMLVLDKARKILMDVEDLYLMSKGMKEPLSAPMTIGVIPTISPYLLPKVLPAVRSQYPDFQLTITEEESQVLVDAVRNGNIDSAIIALPYPHEGLLSFEFWQENFYLVTHKNDKLSKLKKIGADRLDTSTLLLLKEGHCLKDHALAACRLKNSANDKSLSGTSLTTLIQMVAGHMGTTLVPEMALNQLLRDNTELTAIPLNEPGPHRKIAFIARPNYAGVGNIETLKKIFQQQLKSRTSKK